MPVLVLDVTEAEADKILLTFDPISAMAQADKAQMEALLATVRTEDKAIAAILSSVWRARVPGRLLNTERSSTRQRKSTRQPNCRRNGAQR